MRREEGAMGREERGFKRSEIVKVKGQTPETGPTTRF